MTPEKHLAAILAAWNDNPGYGISPAMHEALVLAEKDFDGVEADDFDLDFNHVAVMQTMMSPSPCGESKPHREHAWLDGIHDEVRLVCPGVISRGGNGR